MIERNNDSNDFDLHLLDESGDLHLLADISTLSIENDINEATKYLPPHMKQYFLDCMRNKNPPTPVSEEQRNRLKKHYMSLFGLASGHRYLLSETPPSGSNFVPSSPAANSPPPSPKLPYDPLIQDFFVPSPPPPPSPPVDPQHDNNKQKKALIIAAAASGLIILIGLLLCYFEVRRRKRVDKGDRDLLIVSSSDLSNGMSMSSFSILTY